MTEQPQQNQLQEPVTSLPTVDFYVKRYANTTGDDKKGLGIFMEFEPEAKQRLLKSELLSIKGGRVPEPFLDRVVGKKRKVKFDGGYARWAEVVIMWLSSKR